MERRAAGQVFLCHGHSTVQYSTVQYSTVQYSTVQYSTVQYSTVQYSTVQYSTVQYSTVQVRQLLRPRVVPLSQSSRFTTGIDRCVPYDWVCDGYIHCGDWSDELATNCNNCTGQDTPLFRCIQARARYVLA